jgi:menaquinol-cytochrome c reductase iron-sulfur subunit
MSDERAAAPGVRRRVLKGIVAGVTGAIAAGLATVLGAFAVMPASARRTEQWLRVAPLDEIEPGYPQAIVVTVPKASGWHRSRARQTVYVTWDGENRVQAFSATCTHLGCNVKWDAHASQFRCPCHGGVYDQKGQVVAGPPPRSLTTLQARVDDSTGERHLMVQL